jgi:hypothetical protein
MINKLQLAEIKQAEDIAFTATINNITDAPAYEITDKAGAEWALRKIASCKAAMRENQEMADAEIQRIREWLESENSELQSSITFFESKLAEYMQKENAQDPKCRSIKLPHGTIRLRKMPLKWEFDDDKTITYLEQNYPDMIQIIKKYDKSKVKELIKKSGETWDGVSIEEQPDKFEVEVK